MGYSIIADTFESGKRTQAYMLWYTIGGFGLAIGYAIALFIGVSSLWRNAIYVGSLILFASSILSLTIIEPVKGGSEEEIRDVVKNFWGLPLQIPPKGLILVNKQQNKHVHNPPRDIRHNSKWCNLHMDRPLPN